MYILYIVSFLLVNLEQIILKEIKVLFLIITNYCRTDNCYKQQDESSLKNWKGHKVISVYLSKGLHNNNMPWVIAMVE